MRRRCCQVRSTRTWRRRFLAKNAYSKRPCRYRAIRLGCRYVSLCFSKLFARACLGSRELQYQPTSQDNYPKHQLPNIVTDGMNSSVLCTLRDRRELSLTHDSQQFSVFAECLNHMVPYEFPGSPQILGIHQVWLQDPTTVGEECARQNAPNSYLPCKVM